jgi:hypothetical protein
MPTPTEDPASSLELVALQVNTHKHQREFISGKAGMIGNKTTITTIPIDFKKLGSGYYQAIASQRLEPGEYGLSVGKNAFLFSIKSK